MYTRYHFTISVMLVLLVGCTMPANTKHASNIIKIIHQDEYPSNSTLTQTKSEPKTVGRIEPVAYKNEKNQAQTTHTKKALFQYTIKKTQP